jgi:outer membrane protein TolC
MIRLASLHFVPCTPPRPGRPFLSWSQAFALLLAAAPLIAQPAPIDADFLGRGPSALPHVWKPYSLVSLPALNTNNGPLLQGSIHDGKLALSLADFLRLVVENGFDVESDRYIYLLAQTDYLRARSGQAARGLPGAPVPGGLFAGAIGAGLGNAGNFLSPGGTGATAISAAARQLTITPRGNFDPTFLINFSFDRVVSPLNTVRVSGTPTVTVPSAVLQTRFEQELPYGTSYAVSFNLQRQSTTQRFLLFNPAFTSFFSVSVYQPLLNGFGVALNRRFITVTENNRKVSREIFSANLNTVLSNAANLYWDFVALQELRRVAEQAVAVSEKLYQDNQREFEAGVLARLDVVQAESQLAANRRDLVNAQTNLQMQEVKLKSVISKNISPDLADAQIEATDHLPEPNDIQVPPLSEAIAAATQNLPSIRQAQLGIENQRVAGLFTHRNLLPTFGVFAEFNSYALAGGTNAMFRQMVQWSYPEYAMGFSLNFSVRNRAAQADDVRARIELQQAETTLQRVRRQVELAVRTAAVGLIQFRSVVEAAERAVESSQQTLDGEQIRLRYGISTPYRVILAQRDLIGAQSAQTQAQVNYAKALIAFELATGTLPQRNGIAFDEAFRGDLWKSSGQP